MAASALPTFPLDIETGPGLEASRSGARLRLDIRDEVFLTTGTGNAYRVDTGGRVKELRSGQRLLVQVNRGNSGPAKLNVDGTGPKAWRDEEGNEFANGRLVSGRIYSVVVTAERTWRTELGPASIAGVPGLTDALASKATPATLLDVPAALVAALGAPAIIQPAGSPWRLAAFPFVEAELAKAENIRDLQYAISRAVTTGEHIVLPPSRQPLRSLGVSSAQEGHYAIRVPFDTPVDISGDRGSELYIPVDGEPGDYKSPIKGKAGGVINGRGWETPPQSYKATPLRFRLRNFNIDLSEHATKLGTVANNDSGFGAIIMRGFTEAVVEDMVLNAGYVPLADMIPGQTNLGTGYGDTAIGNGGCWETTYRRVRVIGWYDQGAYNSGINNRRIGLVTDPVMFAAAGRTALLQTTSAHALSVGSAVYFAGLAAVQGVTLAGRYLVTSVPSDTTFTVLAETAAAGPGVGGGASGGLAAEYVDTMEVDPRGEGDVIEDFRAYRCGGAVTLKRNGRQMSIVRLRAIECGDGIVVKIVNLGDSIDPSSQGKRLFIDAAWLNFIQGRPIQLVGGDRSVISRVRIQNFGKLISNPALYTPVDPGQNIAAIELCSVSHSQVHDCIAGQTNPVWAAGAPAAGQQLRGLVARTDPGYKLGSSNNQFHHNQFDKIHQPCVELSANEFDNNWDSNASTDELIPSIYNGTRTSLTEIKERTLSPIFEFTGGGSVTSEIVAKGAVSKGRLKARVDVKILTLSGPAGNPRLRSLPPCVDVATRRFAVHRENVTGAGNVVGAIGYASDTVSFSYEAGGVSSTIPASAFSVGSILSFECDYLLQAGVNPLVYDFVKDNYPTLAATRASTALSEGVAADWIVFAVNALRRTKRGIVVEPAATNLCPRASNLVSGSWIKANATVALDQTSIDGLGNQCSSLTATAANGQATQAITSASSLRTFSVFLRRITGAGPVYITQDGTSWTPVDVTSAFKRFFLTGTLANPVVGVRLGTAGDAVAFDIAQNETWADMAAYPGGPSSPIKSPGSTATARSADNVSIVVPGGVSSIRYTYDDGSTHTVSVSAGAYTLPTTGLKYIGKMELLV